MEYFDLIAHQPTVQSPSHVILIDKLLVFPAQNSPKFDLLLFDVSLTAHQHFISHNILKPHLFPFNNQDNCFPGVCLKRLFQWLLHERVKSYAEVFNVGRVCKTQGQVRLRRMKVPVQKVQVRVLHVFIRKRSHFIGG